MRFIRELIKQINKNWKERKKRKRKENITKFSTIRICKIYIRGVHTIVIC